MLTGVILAGGENRRMNGKLKALLKLDGETILERQLKEMATICDEIIVNTNRQALLQGIARRYGARIVADEIPGKGPLGGMYSAFRVAAGNEAWVVGCDMPFVSARAAKTMLECKNRTKAEAAVPFLHGRWHPLFAIYDAHSVDVLEQCLKTEDYRVRRYLDKLQVCALKESNFQGEVDFVTNINTPAEYESLLWHKRGESV